MNTNSNQGTLNNETTNITVLPPVLEPKKRNRKPISPEVKAERAKAERAKKNELRKEIAKELISALSPEEREKAVNGYSDEYFAMQDRISELVDIRYEEFKKAEKKAGKVKTPKTTNVLDILKRKLSEFAFDIINTEYKSKKTGEVRKFPTFTIDQWKEAAEFGFFNPTRRAPRVRKSKAEKTSETK